MVTFNDTENSYFDKLTPDDITQAMEYSGVDPETCELYHKIVRWYCLLSRNRRKKFDKKGSSRWNREEFIDKDSV